MACCDRRSENVQNKKGVSHNPFQFNEEINFRQRQVTKNTMKKFTEM
jgi:hypothetical protein